jgi:hypothetical protein
MTLNSRASQLHSSPEALNLIIKKTYAQSPFAFFLFLDGSGYQAEIKCILLRAFTV